jgi:hypothetical protein
VLLFILAHKDRLWWWIEEVDRARAQFAEESATLKFFRDFIY